MCLGIPGQVVEKVEGYGGQLALVDVVGVQRRINLGMLDDEDQAACGRHVQMVGAAAGNGSTGRGIGQMAVRHPEASTDRVCTWET